MNKQIWDSWLSSLLQYYPKGWLLFTSKSVDFRTEQKLLFCNFLAVFLILPTALAVSYIKYKLDHLDLIKLAEIIYAVDLAYRKSSRWYPLNDVEDVSDEEYDGGSRVKR